MLGTESVKKCALTNECAKSLIGVLHFKNSAKWSELREESDALQLACRYSALNLQSAHLARYDCNVMVMPSTGHVQSTLTRLCISWVVCKQAYKETIIKSQVLLSTNKVLVWLVLCYIGAYSLFLSLSLVGHTCNKKFPQMRW